MHQETLTIDERGPIRVRVTTAADVTGRLPARGRELAAERRSKRRSAQKFTAWAARTGSLRPADVPASDDNGEPYARELPGGEWVPDLTYDQHAVACSIRPGKRNRRDRASRPDGVLYRGTGIGALYGDPDGAHLLAALAGWTIRGTEA